MTDTDPARVPAAVGFSPDELALNQEGKLSDRQRAALARSRHGGRVGILIMIVLVLVFVVVIAIVVLPKINKPQHGSSQVPIVPIVAGTLAFVVLVIGLSLLRLRRRLNRLASGAVLRVDGPARTREHHLGGNVSDAGPIYGGGVRYELTIGPTTFFVAGPRVLEAFDSGAIYRAYYAAGGGHNVYNWLLSAEQIG